MDARPDRTCAAGRSLLGRALFFTLLAALFTCGMGLSSPRAEPAKKQLAGGGPPPLAERVHWYDGNKRRALWISGDELAEFAPSEEGGKAVGESDAEARELPGLGRGVRLWKVGPGRGAAEVMSKSRRGHPAGRYSPVLHEGPMPGSRRRALSGGVIVVLDPGWSAEEVEAWLKKRNLSVRKRLRTPPNALLIETPAGLPSLEKANALYESGEVEAAFPDWWSERVTR